MSPIASDSSTAQLEPSGEPNLRRDLRLPQVLAIVIGAIVGTGIYIRPASIAQMLGSPGLIIGVWLAGGALALCGALTYAQLAVRFPGTGGEYVFLKATIGRLPAFLYGWMRLAVGPAVIRVMAVAFTVFVGDIVPLGDPWTQIRWTWGTTAGAVELGPRQAIAVSAILGLAWINTKGVGRAGSFQLVVTSGKVLGLLLLLATIAVFGHSSVEQQPLPEAVRGPFVLEFGGALLAVMSAYNGWANAAIVGGEVWDAKRTVPFALVAGIMIVTGLYVMSNLAFLHTLSLQDIGTANSSRHPHAPSVASRAVNHALGPRAAVLLPILFAVSALGTAHCNVLVVPRVFLSMARDGFLPSYLSKVSSQSATPNRAIWTFACIAAIFASFGTVDRLSNMTAFAFLVFFALTTIGYLLILRATPPGARDATFWFTSSVAVLFLLGTSLLILATIARGSFEVLTAVALLSAGIPMFAASEFFRRRRARRLACSLRAAAGRREGTKGPPTAGSGRAPK